jgi:RIO-like serine/threonine protein kinase
VQDDMQEIFLKIHQKGRKIFKKICTCRKNARNYSRNTAKTYARKHARKYAKNMQENMTNMTKYLFDIFSENMHSPSY